MDTQASHAPAILVVEDDITFRPRVVTAVQPLRMPVVEAKDGEEAWNIVKARPIVAVVLDLVMPGKDGLWFLEQVRDSLPFKDLPIIVFTNLEHGEKIGKAIAKGVSRLLVKSEESLGDLVPMIKEVIAEQKASGS